MNRGAPRAIEVICMPHDGQCAEKHPNSEVRIPQAANVGESIGNISRTLDFWRMDFYGVQMLDRESCERRVYRLATLLTGDPRAATAVIIRVVDAQPDLRRLD